MAKPVNTTQAPTAGGSNLLAQRLAEAETRKQEAIKKAAARAAAKSAPKAQGEVDPINGGAEYSLTQEGINGWSLTARFHFGIPAGMLSAKDGRLYLAKGLDGCEFTCPNDPMFGELAGKEVYLGAPQFIIAAKERK